MPKLLIATAVHSPAPSLLILDAKSPTQGWAARGDLRGARSPPSLRLASPSAGGASADRRRCRARSRPEQLSRARARGVPVTRDTCETGAPAPRSSQITHLSCLSQPAFSVDLSQHVCRGVRGGAARDPPASSPSNSPRNSMTPPLLTRVPRTSLELPTPLARHLGRS